MTMMSVLTLVSGKEDRTLRRIRVSEIARNPNQPRKYFDPEAIAQLAESIRQYGVLNPLTVRRALDFFEEAYGFKRLIDQYGLTQEEAARKVGKTQSAVANKLRLLRLSPQNMELIRSANLTERHARCLLRLRDDEERMNATHYIIENELNVSRSEEYIENLLEQKKHPELTEPPHKDNVVRLIKDVRFFLNTLNRAVGVMVDAGIGATVDRQENEDGITLTINIPHAKS